jgi:hypothetical protein
MNDGNNQLAIQISERNLRAQKIRPTQIPTSQIASMATPAVDRIQRFSMRDLRGVACSPPLARNKTAFAHRLVGHCCGWRRLHRLLPCFCGNQKKKQEGDEAGICDRRFKAQIVLYESPGTRSLLPTNPPFVKDRATSVTVLNTQNFSDFQQGIWAVWNLKGNVVITVTKPDMAMQ